MRQRPAPGSLGPMRNLLRRAGAAVLIASLLGTVWTWPLVLEPDLSDSLRLYRHALTRTPIQLSSLLGSIDIACAIGPYDSFKHPRFSAQLSPAQSNSGEAALQRLNQTSFGDNRYVLIGWRGNQVSKVYVSHLFSKTTSNRSNQTAQRDCINGLGSVIPRNDGNMTTIEFTDQSIQH